jgi:hypothetical protein
MTNPVIFWRGFVLKTLGEDLPRGSGPYGHGSQCKRHFLDILRGGGEQALAGYGEETMIAGSLLMAPQPGTPCYESSGVVLRLGAWRRRISSLFQAK